MKSYEIGFQHLNSNNCLGQRTTRIPKLSWKDPIGERSMLKMTNESGSIDIGASNPVRSLAAR